MSNLMDKISSKLGSHKDNNESSDGPSSNTRSRSNQDQSYSTQDQQGYSGGDSYDNQGYTARPQDTDMGFNADSQGTMNQSGTMDQSYGMYDQDNADMSSGRKQTGQQQGYGTTTQDASMGSGATQGNWGSSNADDFDNSQQDQAQFQRRF